MKARHPRPKDFQLSAAPSQQASTRLCLDLLQVWRSSQTPPRHIMRQYAHDLRSLQSRERKNVENLFYTLVRHWGSIEVAVEQTLARVPIKNTRPGTRTKLHIAALAASTVFDDAGFGELPKALARELADVYVEALDEVRQSWPGDGDALAQLALTSGFSTSIVSDFVARLGAEQATVALASLNERAPLILRVRPTHTSDSVLAALAKDKIGARVHRWLPQAIVVEDHVRLDKHRVITTGMATVQDVASQLAVMALDVQPGQTVIDMCAGGGGKAFAIADQLGDSGRLILLDIDADRLEGARERIAAFSQVVVETIAIDSSQIPPTKLKQVADRVLVDAPCTGLGTARRNPDLKWRYSDSDVKTHVKLQRALLSRSIDLLKERGLACYVTCSLRQQENEKVVDKVLGQTAFEMLALQHSLGDLAEQLGASNDRLTLWPHLHDCDGFFIALMQKK